MTKNKNNVNYLTNDYDPENYYFVDIINRKIKEIKGKSGPSFIMKYEKTIQFNPSLTQKREIMKKT